MDDLQLAETDSIHIMPRLEVFGQKAKHIFNFCMRHLGKSIHPCGVSPYRHCLAHSQRFSESTRDVEPQAFSSKSPCYPRPLHSMVWLPGRDFWSGRYRKIGHFQNLRSQSRPVHSVLRRPIKWASNQDQLICPAPRNAIRNTAAFGYRTVN